MEQIRVGSSRAKLLADDASDSIVDEVTSRLLAEGVVFTKGLRATAGNGYYGRYLSLREVGAFLAWDLRRWTTLAWTPLWITVFGREWSRSRPEEVRRAMTSLERERAGVVFTADDGYPTIALMVPTGVERDAVIEHVIPQVVRVGELIAHLGSASDEELAPPLDM